VYVADDVVAANGATYVCAVGHTSADEFITDLDIDRWTLKEDGQYTGTEAFEPVALTAITNNIDLPAICMMGYPRVHRLATYHFLKDNNLFNLVATSI
jgi:hypothetical protein